MYIFAVCSNIAPSGVSSTGANVGSSRHATEGWSLCCPAAVWSWTSDGDPAISCWWVLLLLCAAADDIQDPESTGWLITKTENQLAGYLCVCWKALAGKPVPPDDTYSDVPVIPNSSFNFNYQCQLQLQLNFSCWKNFSSNSDFS